VGGVRLHGGEHLTDEAGRRPRDQADRAARTADAYEFVCGSLMMWSEHHTQAGEDGVELIIAVRKGFGVRDFPGQPDTHLGGPLLSDLH
jgi:hypothetical protein